MSFNRFGFMRCHRGCPTLTSFPCIFSYIDQGKNPNLYTKDCLEKALNKNEQVKGKIDNLKVWHTLQRYSICKGSQYFFTKHLQYVIFCTKLFRWPGPKVINFFQLSMKFLLLINVKMPTLVGILTFMSRKNSLLSLSDPGKS